MSKNTTFSTNHIVIYRLCSLFDKPSAILGNAGLEIDFFFCTTIQNFKRWVTNFPKLCSWTATEIKHFGSYSVYRALIIHPLSSSMPSQQLSHSSYLKASPVAHYYIFLDLQGYHEYVMYAIVRDTEQRWAIALLLHNSMKTHSKQIKTHQYWNSNDGQPKRTLYFLHDNS